ncbi:unnamed protein product, partial [Laminaria digitata]
KIFRDPLHHTAPRVLAGLAVDSYTLALLRLHARFGNTLLGVRLRYTFLSSAVLRGNTVISRAGSWMTKSRQLGISWLGILLFSCSGANSPTTWAYLCKRLR